jgi:hypothetical protein
MNILVKYALLLAAILFVGPALVRAEDLSPADKAVAQAKADLQAAEDAKAQADLLEKEQKRLAWSRKTLGEAMAIRGQAVVDYSQWGMGRAVEYSSYADGKVFEYGIVFPVSLVQSGIANLETGAKGLADNSFNNEVTVAVKAPETK